MAATSSRKFPLPPRRHKENAKSKRRLRRRIRKVAKISASEPVQEVNQELYKRNAELRARNKTLAVLRKLDEISLSVLGAQEMSQQMASAIAAEFGYDLVAIAVEEGNEKKLQWWTFASAIPWITEVVQVMKERVFVVSLASGSVVDKSLHNGAVSYIDNPQEIYPSELLMKLKEADQSPEVEEVKHTALYPLRFGKEILGVLTLSSSRPLQAISDYERESVSGIVGLVSLAIYKAKIYQDLQNTTIQLEDANKQLQDLDKAKSEFLNIASHQLYTPLTALRGYLSMLTEGDYGDVPTKQKPIIKILETSTTRLIELIKGLLDISRIESGRLELNLQSQDIVEMAKTLVEDLLPNARNKKLQLLFHKPPHPLPHVVGDQERLRQVMLNFIDNAIKYTDQGTVNVHVVQEGDEIVFSVQDTGRGMTLEETKRLFNKFTRVGSASRYHTEGSGLGLYVARQITREHKGDVIAQSPGPGQGSTFSLRLPIEGTAKSLKVGEKATVIIKAAEAQQ